MFAYNEFSDLLNSNELVTPIKKVGENILCLNSKGEEVVYSFDDFDFDKTIEERSFIVISDDTPEQEEPINQPNEQSNDTEELTNQPNEHPTEEPVNQPKEYSFDTNNDPHWLKNDEAKIIASNFGYITSRNTKGIKEFEITNY